MIDFESRNHMGAAGYSYAEKLKEEIKRIDELLLQDRKNKLELGWALLELWNSRCYCESAYAKQSSSTLSGRAFFAVLEGIFDISKTTAWNLINVVDEFCREHPPDLDPHWQAFSYSALVEMLPLTPTQRKQITPAWSARRIREFRRNLMLEKASDECSDVGTLVENSENDLEEASELSEREPEDAVRSHPAYRYYMGRPKEDLVTRVIVLEIEQRELIKIINENGIKIEPK